MLELTNICKYFPGVKALDDVSLKFNLGEIHGIIGENGAGKSTCIKIVSGLLKQDSGSVKINGSTVNLHSYHFEISKEITNLDFGDDFYNVISNEIATYIT